MNFEDFALKRVDPWGSPYVVMTHNVRDHLSCPEPIAWQGNLSDVTLQDLVDAVKDHILLHRRTSD